MPPRSTPGEIDLAGIILGLTQQITDLNRNVGELTGQMREQIHVSNNNAAKLDEIGRRVLALEKADSRREGASGLVSMILHSPALGWLFLGAVALWAFLTGKVRM